MAGETMAGQTGCRIPDLMPFLRPQDISVIPPPCHKKKAKQRKVNTVGSIQSQGA